VVEVAEYTPMGLQVVLEVQEVLVAAEMLEQIVML
jgi:hypothetical protein